MPRPASMHEGMFHVTLITEAVAMPASAATEPTERSSSP
jgi:hypothetical protein